VAEAIIQKGKGTSNKFRKRKDKNKRGRANRAAQESEHDSAFFYTAGGGKTYNVTNM